MSESSKMKRLYTFTLNKDEEVEKSEKSKNEKNEEITVTKRVIEKISHPFFIKKPTRSLYDEAELFHGSEMRKAVNAGMMTRSQLEKHFINDGGILSNPERESYAKLLTDLREKQITYQKLNLQKEKTPEETKQVTTLLTDLLNIQNELQKFEYANENLFSATADIRVRNKTVMWWILNTSYKDEGGKEIPFFNCETLEDKFKHLMEFAATLF